MALDGVEIFTNSSGSHHELRKLSTRINLIKEATLKSGGLYLYSNQQGCDGDRLYYDGCSFITLNGQVIAQGSQFSLNDVEVVSATVDLQRIRAHRTISSRSMQAAGNQVPFQRFRADTRLGKEIHVEFAHPAEEAASEHAREFEYNLPEEEIACVALHPVETSASAAQSLRLAPQITDWTITRLRTGTARLAGCGTISAGPV